jgi:hypothetical protein
MIDAGESLQALHSWHPHTQGTGEDKEDNRNAKVMVNELAQRYQQGFRSASWTHSAASH